MKVGSFLIGKEQVWFPDGVQHGGVQVQRVVWVFSIGQPGVIPLLTKEDVHPVVLRGRKESKSNRLGLRTQTQHGLFLTGFLSSLWTFALDRPVGKEQIYGVPESSFPRLSPPPPLYGFRTTLQRRNKTMINIMSHSHMSTPPLQLSRFFHPDATCSGEQR